MENNQKDLSHRSKHSDDSRINIGKIDRILIEIQRQLRDSLEPYSVKNLNSYERKRIHSFFDEREDFETKTYRREDLFVLKVFPVGNIQRRAKEKAEQVLETGDVYTFPYLPGYERFLVHNYLKDFKGIETKSIGEENERRLEIRPVKFGRTLKKIIKKIKII